MLDLHPVSKSKTTQMNKISRIFMAVVAMLAVVAAQAQTSTRWGVTAGANYNQVHFKQSDIMPVDRAFGPTVGLTGEMNIQGIGFGLKAFNHLAEFLVAQLLVIVVNFSRHGLVECKATG